LRKANPTTYTGRGVIIRQKASAQKKGIPFATAQNQR